MYLQCDNCALVFVPVDQLLSFEDEMERYSQHNNSSEDPRYCKYLQGKIDDMQELGVDLSAGTILDFGAGENGVMTELLKEQGYDATAYDPAYGLDDLSKAPYHLIIMNEVIEHLYTPMDELKKLYELLASGGYLYINTEMIDTVKEFENWWYRNDPTHVIFFSEKTFEYLADALCLTLCHSNHKNRVLFQKK